MTRSFDSVSRDAKSTGGGRAEGLRRGERRRNLDRRFGRIVRRFRIDLPAETKASRGASGAGREKKN